MAATTRSPSSQSPQAVRVTWSAVRQARTRPYPVTAPMVALVALVPFYLIIAGRAHARADYVPSLAVDHVLPLAPVWALVYGALYAFLIILPVFVIQQPGLIRRTAHGRCRGAAVGCLRASTTRRWTVTFPDRAAAPQVMRGR